MIENLYVDKEHVKQVFADYVAAYNPNDPKIRLKIEHTYRVADLCERIAVSEKMTEDEIMLSWLLGMFHDVGRFDQVKEYHTFQDALSVDHAGLSADILFGKGNYTHALVLDFLPRTDLDGQKETFSIMENAIRAHSAFRIPFTYSEEEKRFADLLRDADKIDILRVQLDFPLTDIYNCKEEELLTAEVTPEVSKSFYEHKAVLRALKKTPVDHIVGHLSLVFELVYPESLRIVKEQQYMEKLFGFASKNEKTLQLFRRMHLEMERYLKEKGL